MFGDGVNVQPILYPAVDESAARLRFFMTSVHSEDQIRYTIDRLVYHLEDLGQLAPPVESAAARRGPIAS
jgi:hypothetical protein